MSSFLNVKLDDAQKMRIFLPTELFPRDSSLLLPFYLHSMLLIQPAVLYPPNDALRTTAVHITSPFRGLRSRALLQLGRCMYSTDRNQGLFRFLCSKLMFSFLPQRRHKRIGSKSTIGLARIRLNDERLRFASSIASDVFSDHVCFAGRSLAHGHDRHTFRSAGRHLRPDLRPEFHSKPKAFS